MKLQVRINKKPFNKIHIVGLIKACDKSLSLKQAKDMVDEETEKVSEKEEYHFYGWKLDSYDLINGKNSY